jgi:16S rRNA (uracil1498-N3)-methyltransferase
MSRYFYSPEREKEGYVILGQAESHHLEQVLRSKPGDELELCDEAGVCRRAEITTVGKPGVTCRLLGLLPDNEPSVRVTLAFGLLKGEKTEFVLQKATELGVSGFIPFSSGHSVMRLTDKKAQDRLQRWQKIVRSAAGQCRRNRIPEVRQPCHWESLPPSFHSYHRVLFCWEGERMQSLGQLMQDVEAGSDILVITGPEGGFSHTEAGEAINCGAQAVTLGSRILRAETAALTAAALVLYEAGELGGRP